LKKTDVQILHISGSPKGERSASLKMANVFLDHYLARHPGHQVHHIDTFDEVANPDFGNAAAQHKFAPIFGEAQTDEGKAAWQGVERIIEMVKTSGKIVVSCPMWNYSVPWAMKRFLDNLVQPGWTFGYDFKKMQHIGLLENRPLQLILTRSSTMAGDYADFQLPYLTYMFGAIGIRDTRVICASATTQPGADARQNYVEGFYPQLRAAAENF
jgi:FMN-dependent NADH-azoreductase